jgi:hypothetical protein
MSLRSQAATDVSCARTTRDEKPMPVLAESSTRAIPKTVRGPAGFPGRRFAPDAVSARAGLDGVPPTVLATPPVGVEAGPGCTPLPLPQLSAPSPHQATHYVVTAIDDRGRLGDTSAAAVLGWTVCVALTFSVLSGVTGVAVTRGGYGTLTGRGRLLLPVAVRRVLRLEPGERLLVAAHPDRDLLIVYTMTALDAMIAWLHGAPTYGAAA